MSSSLQRTTFDTPILPRLETVLAEVRRGIYRIPEFQRPFIWSDDQRLKLLDSIVKGLPIGSLLVWRTTQQGLIQSYPEIANIPVIPELVGTVSTYVIDGHQRISTLFGALIAPKQPRVTSERRWPIYYELGTEENPAFRLPPRTGQMPPPHWIPLDILFDGKKLFTFRDALYKAGEDEKAEEAERLANLFKDYILPVVPLVTEELDLVTDAFVRINSQGSGMSEAHMLRALTHLKQGYDTDIAFRKIRDILEPLGWGEIDEAILVNCLKAIFELDVYRASVRELNERLKKEPGSLNRLEEALVEAIALLAELGVRGVGALPYAHQLVVLVALAAGSPTILGKPNIRTLMRCWFVRTTYLETFTGITGSGIRAMLAALQEPDYNEWDLATSPDWQSEPIERRLIIRKGTVRAKALALFLARQPQDASVRAQREEIAASQQGQPGQRLALLFPEEAAVPGNIVIATPSELKRLRAALRTGSITPTEHDTFALPTEPLIGLNTNARASVRDFLIRRTKLLLEAEAQWIAPFGLSADLEREQRIEDVLTTPDALWGDWG